MEKAQVPPKRRPLVIFYTVNPKEHKRKWRCVHCW